MKFANLYWQNTEVENSKMVPINIGDNLQFMAIEYLYSKFLPDNYPLVKLQMRELKKYQGETLILPMNWSLFDINYMDGNRISISEDIVPVFLGATIESASHKEVFFNDYNILYLKRFEPIGCRDEFTFKTLCKYHIQAYLNGCMTAVFPRRQKNEGQNKIFLVDAPIELQEYIPDSLKEGAEILTQQYYCSKDVEIAQILDAIKKQYFKYANEAALVITSRLHVASPCMAMGIPVIFVKNQVDARFGWLDNYIPLYDRHTYNKIDWNPQPVEYEKVKELIIRNAIDRINDVYEKYTTAQEVSQIYAGRNEKKYVNFQSTIYENFERAYLFLENKFKTSDTFLYSIWGVNEAAEKFYEYMCSQYPNARLKNIIDSYKEIEFHGRKAIKPETFIREENEFIFVLPVKASNDAERIFSQKGIDQKYYVCCGDQFITFGREVSKLIY